MYSFIYNYIFIPIALLYVKLFKKRKAKLAEREENCRKSWMALDILPENQPRIWFHSASMGEFEQVKPVIENIKRMRPEVQIICSFFSPSGYNTQKNYPYADAIVYMPLDTKRNAKKFIELINPSIAVFVRYEIWRNHLMILKEKSIPRILINATQPSRKFYRNFILTQLFIRSSMNLFNNIYTVSRKHTKYFKRIGVRSYIRTMTDTRYDRIVAKIEEAKTKKIIPRELFDENEYVLIAGSTWEPDEKLIYKAVEELRQELNLKIRVLYVPHEPTKERLNFLSNLLFGNFIYLSEVLELLKSNKPYNEIRQIINYRDIICDSIGKLLQLYAIGNFAYIGGGFGEGVHSVAEPGGYGLPLSCGPKIKKSYDALYFLENGALQIISSPKYLTQWLYSLIIDKEKRNSLGEIPKNHIYQSAGSSRLISLKLINQLDKLKE
ncbi:MAG TPA: glycosyltransferase N-terminal domain-containing protein [Candidatus Kapabacteria bacterium]|nr:hypothetical protein [Candidatus Kapabacteria bacterium]HOV92044.1 glycosyltransferase N-terminal domain-containing protein [Candidatus Kapabacteria bacterium]